MLDSVASRMSERLDAGWWHSFQEEHPREELERHFTEDEIDRLEERAGDPEAEHLRAHADAMFVVSALYQINGFLDELSKEHATVWKEELASAGNQFRQAYKEAELEQLRHVIEHADEHISLEKSEIAVDFDSWAGVGVMSKGLGPVTIHMFGMGGSDAGHFRLAAARKLGSLGTQHGEVNVRNYDGTKPSRSRNVRGRHPVSKGSDSGGDWYRSPR